MTIKDEVEEQQHKNQATFIREELTSVAPEGYNMRDISLRVYQTEFGKYGNCLPACLATYFNMPLKDVPHFCKLYPSDWFIHCDKWLQTLGYTMAEVPISPQMLVTMRGIMFITGFSGRGFLHQVLYRDGVLWHDPHLDGGGVTPKEDGMFDWTIIYPLDPQNHRGPLQYILHHREYVERPIYDLNSAMKCQQWAREFVGVASEGLTHEQ